MISLSYVASNMQLLDIFTKSLPKIDIIFLVDKLMMSHHQFEGECAVNLVGSQFFFFKFFLVSCSSLLVIPVLFSLGVLVSLVIYFFSVFLFSLLYVF